MVCTNVLMNSTAAVAKRSFCCWSAWFAGGTQPRVGGMVVTEQPRVLAVRPCEVLRYGTLSGKWEDDLYVAHYRTGFVTPGWGWPLPAAGQPRVLLVALFVRAQEICRLLTSPILWADWEAWPGAGGWEGGAPLSRCGGGPAVRSSALAVATAFAATCPRKSCYNRSRLKGGQGSVLPAPHVVGSEAAVRMPKARQDCRMPTLACKGAVRAVPS